MESGQRHQWEGCFPQRDTRVQPSTIGQTGKRNILVLFPVTMGSVFSHHSKALEIKLKLSFVRLFCNFASYL